MKEIAALTAQLKEIEFTLSQKKEELKATMLGDGVLSGDKEYLGYKFTLKTKPLDFHICELNLVPEDFIKKLPDLKKIHSAYKENPSFCDAFVTVTDFKKGPTPELGYILEMRKCPVK